MADIGVDVGLMLDFLDCLSFANVAMASGPEWNDQEELGSVVDEMDPAMSFVYKFFLDDGILRNEGEHFLASCTVTSWFKRAESVFQESGMEIQEVAEFAYRQFEEMRQGSAPSSEGISSLVELLAVLHCSVLEHLQDLARVDEEVGELSDEYHQQELEKLLQGQQPLTEDQVVDLVFNKPAQEIGTVVYIDSLQENFRRYTLFNPAPLPPLGLGSGFEANDGLPMSGDTFSEYLTEEIFLIQGVYQTMFVSGALGVVLETGFTWDQVEPEILEELLSQAQGPIHFVWEREEMKTQIPEKEEEDDDGVQGVGA